MRGEIEKMLAEDAWDKKRAGHAKHRSRGPMRTPVDYLSGKSKQEYQEQKYVNLSKIRAFEDFKELTDKQKKKVLKKWMKIHTLDSIYQFPGWNPVLFFKQLQPFGFKMGDFAQRRVNPVENQEHKDNHVEHVESIGDEVTEPQAQENNLEEISDDMQEEIIALSWDEFKYKVSEKIKHLFLTKERMEYGNSRMIEHWGKKSVTGYLYTHYTKRDKELPPINRDVAARNSIESRKETKRRKDTATIENIERNYLELVNHPEKADVYYLSIPSEKRAELLNQWFQTHTRKSLIEVTGWSENKLNGRINALRKKGYVIEYDSQKKWEPKEKAKVIETEQKDQTPIDLPKEKENDIPISQWIQEQEMTTAPLESMPKETFEGFQTKFKKDRTKAEDAAKRLRMLAALIEESGGDYRVSIVINELEPQDELLLLEEPHPEEKPLDAIDEKDLKLLQLLKELR